MASNSVLRLIIIFRNEGKALPFVFVDLTGSRHCHVPRSRVLTRLRVGLLTSELLSCRLVEAILAPDRLVLDLIGNWGVTLFEVAALEMDIVLTRTACGKIRNYVLTALLGTVAPSA